MIRKRTQVLVVEDDDAMRSLYPDLFGSRYEVDGVTTGEAALRQVKAEPPELVILDLRLPDVDGLILLSELRKLSDVGMLVCSARDTTTDRVLAFRAGADAFVAKPFDIDEFMARVEAVLRRCRAQRVAEVAAESKESTGPTSGAHVVSWSVGPLTVSSDGTLTIGGLPFRVTKTQHLILMKLVPRHGATISRSVLADGIWGSPDLDESAVHTVNAHISNLRIVLGKHPGAPVIETDRFGVGGYSIRPAPAAG